MTIVISHAHVFSRKLILSAADPTADSLFFRQGEISSGKLILATVGSTDLLLKRLISTPGWHEPLKHSPMNRYPVFLLVR